VTFPTNAYVLAFLGAALVTAGSLPLWRAWCERAGHVDDPGHRKIHGRPIPLAGGLAVFTGLAVVILAGVAAVQLRLLDAEALEKLRYGLGRRAVPLTAVLLGGCGMVLLGWLDDRRDLTPAVKFGGQALIALLVALSGVRLTLFVPSAVFSHAVTVLWILAVTNAFNLSDNMNGLCAGLGLIGAALFAAVAAHHGQYLVASLALLVAGALLGYLPYNFPRASVFLGDAGSHLVGYLMAVLAILPHFYSSRHADPSPIAVLSPLAILAVPLLDTTSVCASRTLAGKPFWVGDTNHLSHRLARAGLGKTGAVVALWLVALALGSLALL
jgi:UDP-GlcNAc:undecaprenyl-phosphate/decaprenyl-phosphate GlcNAc-1-phosphate transferase